MFFSSVVCNRVLCQGSEVTIVNLLLVNALKYFKLFTKAKLFGKIVTYVQPLLTYKLLTKISSHSHV